MVGTIKNVVKLLVLLKVLVFLDNLATVAASEKGSGQFNEHNPRTTYSYGLFSTSISTTIAEQHQIKENKQLRPLPDRRSRDIGNRFLVNANETGSSPSTNNTTTEGDDFLSTTSVGLIAALSALAFVGSSTLLGGLFYVFMILFSSRKSTDKSSSTRKCKWNCCRKDTVECDEDNSSEQPQVDENPMKTSPNKFKTKNQMEKAKSDQRKQSVRRFGTEIFRCKTTPNRTRNHDSIFVSPGAVTAATATSSNSYTDDQIIGVPKFRLFDEESHPFDEVNYQTETNPSKTKSNIGSSESILSFLESVDKAYNRLNGVDTVGNQTIETRTCYYDEEGNYCGENCKDGEANMVGTGNANKKTTKVRIGVDIAGMSLESAAIDNNTSRLGGGQIHYCTSSSYKNHNPNYR